MLADFLEKLFSLNRRAMEPKFDHPAMEPPHVYYALNPCDGEMKRVEAEPFPRDHKVLSLDGIVQFALDFTVEDQHPEVWYSRKGVTVLLSRDDRRDRVVMPLSFSPQLKKLMEFDGKRTGHNQKAFVNLLRVDLAPGINRNLIDALRYLKFRTAGQSEGLVGHGKSSIGRSLEAELDGAQKVPDEVYVGVPIWDGFDAHALLSVQCALDVDAQAEQFFLLPLPGAIERAVREAEEKIGADLVAMLHGSDDEAKAKVPVIYGTP